MKGYSEASFKKFSTLVEAQEFCEANSPQRSDGACFKDGDGEVKESRNLPVARVGCAQQAFSSERTKPQRYFELKRGSEESQDRCIVYVDGSCLNNGQQGAAAGFGVYFPETNG